MSEALCLRPPFLPFNRPDQPHHLPAGTVACHVDIHFRLLRHDMLAPLWSKALFLHSLLEGERRKREGDRWEVAGGEVEQVCADNP